uniref:ATPase subunit 8 n=1 Tax=Durinskia baltica diatom endosymbiont TaxID=1079368 RepID=I6N5M7_9STRA|nr:ATPase subunit 8 [Durinskia baltica diatom endosymbiont]
MPQFDFSTLSVVLFSSVLSAAVYYAFIALRLLPDIITVLKFRTKKLFKENSLSLDLVFLPKFFSVTIL